jgi:glutamate carboxypeptidase
MNNDYQPYLSWINTQIEEMIYLVNAWANINSGSYHLEGLAKMMTALKQSFQILGGDIEEISLPPFQTMNIRGEIIRRPLGNALSIRKRPEADFQVFLGGHMDTVYPQDSPFQKTVPIDDQLLIGPGVADMKGGLVVMLKALQALEMSPFAKNLGWEILINPDEEIGSPGSQNLFKTCAKRNNLGIIFEPALPDGSLVIKRKGSAVYAIHARGKPAHVGREFSKGRNAVHAIISFLDALQLKCQEVPDFILNIGFISGGGEVNVVPDSAFCRLNIRSWDASQISLFEKTMDEIQKKIEPETGVLLQIFKEISRPPKSLDDKTREFFERIASCGQEIGIQLKGESTGGVTDGNVLANAGLPNLDNLGVRGGKLHTPEEYIHLDSLAERARLTALFLMKLSKIRAI